MLYKARHKEILKGIYTFVNIWDIIYIVTVGYFNGGFAMDDEPEKTKKFYEETITKLTKSCNDIELLDLIITLLQKSGVSQLQEAGVMTNH